MSLYLKNCPNCGTENELFYFSCRSCGNVLHIKVANIDLWKTIGNLADKPTDSFIEIIYSERKNFAFFFLLLGIVKLYFLKELTQNIILANHNVFSFRNVLIILIAHLFIIITIEIKVRVEKKKVRLKDIFALFAYSYIPIIIGAFILFPIEFGIFGKSWISFQPSPFFLKENAAYLLVGLEYIFLIISGLFIYLNINLFFDNRILCIILTTVFLLFQLFF